MMGNFEDGSRELYFAIDKEFDLKYFSTFAELHAFAWRSKGAGALVPVRALMLDDAVFKDKPPRRILTEIDNLRGHLAHVAKLLNDECERCFDKCHNGGIDYYMARTDALQKRMFAIEKLIAIEQAKLEALKEDKPKEQPNGLAAVISKTKDGEI